MPSQDVSTVSALKPTLNISKRNFVIGNDSQWVRTITDLLAGDTPINGWLTIKSSPAVSDASGVQVPIGLVSSGLGQIVGFVCTFNVQAQATLVLHAGPLYYYDIKVQVTPSRDIYTVEQGWIQWLPEVGDQPIPGNASQNLPPIVPIFLFGPNPPPNGLFAVGTWYLVVPPDPGFPASWVFASDLSWHVNSVVG